MTLAEHVEPGDTLIDRGNSYYKDDVRRAGILRPKGFTISTPEPVAEYGAPSAATVSSWAERSRP